MRVAVHSLILVAILTAISAPRAEASPLCGTTFYDPILLTEVYSSGADVIQRDWCRYLNPGVGGIGGAIGPVFPEYSVLATFPFNLPSFGLDMYSPPGGVDDLLDDFLSDGATFLDGALNKLKGAVRRGPGPRCDKFDPQCPPRIKSPPAQADGVRGSFELFGGVELFKNSPAFVGGAVDFSNLAADTGLYFPFAVTDRGVGEWFGWTLNGLPLWTGLTSDFVENQLYLGFIPYAVVAGQKGYAQFTLYQTTTAPTSVLLGDDPALLVFTPEADGPNTVPEPASLLLMSTGLIGIAARAVRSRTARRRMNHRL
jgi:PEP-CTERM motif